MKLLKNKTVEVETIVGNLICGIEDKKTIIRREDVKRILRKFNIDANDIHFLEQYHRTTTWESINLFITVEEVYLVLKKLSKRKPYTKKYQIGGIDIDDLFTLKRFLKKLSKRKLNKLIRKEIKKL